MRMSNENNNFSFFLCVFQIVFSLIKKTLSHLKEDHLRYRLRAKMTNSTPKNNKVEKHGGSPSSNGKKRSQNYIRTATYFANGGGNNNNNNSNSPNLASCIQNGGRNNKSPGARQSSSPLSCSSKNITRYSPTHVDSPRFVIFL